MKSMPARETPADVADGEGAIRSQLSPKLHKDWNENLLWAFLSVFTGFESQITKNTKRVQKWEQRPKDPEKKQ